MSTAEYTHIPVLFRETVAWMQGACSGNPKRIIDGTLGCGGHSAGILKACPDAELLGIDRDSDALERSAVTLAFAGKRFHPVKGNFSQMRDAAGELGWDRVDAILLDIGLSSPQIDDPARGFSFRSDGPLDMRMDQDNPVPASRILNRESESELVRIFRECGELEKNDAMRLASAIVRARVEKPLERTKEFAELCEKTLRKNRRNGPPVPTLPFQALRIAVNHELEELETALNEAVELLNPGGRLCVITFHSLEDRIVKNFFRDMAVNCKCPPGLPVCICGWKPRLEILTKHPVTASEEELRENSRANCAKLRTAGRLA